MSDGIVALLIAFMGGSALATLIQAIFSRAKNKAEAGAIERGAASGEVTALSGAVEKIIQASDRSLEIYSKALDMAALQIGALEDRVGVLETTLVTMKEEKIQRDITIEALKRENTYLREELIKLQEAVKCRDKTIANLRKRLSELEVQLKNMA